VAKYTFNKLIEEVLFKSPIPMSPNDIWEYALKNGQTDKLTSIGKTPQATISARIYGDIKYNENPVFKQISKRPALFGMSNKEYDAVESAETKQSDNDTLFDLGCEFDERDLHPLLVAFTRNNPHFMCYAKTIFHENSKKRQKGYNEWLHPDMVGVQFPHDEYDIATRGLLKSFSCNQLKIFSFELKIELNFRNVRQCYFQALSNSSWANEGYLVALKLEKDPEFMNEISRLNNAFGIGIILLDLENIEQSEIIFTSKSKDVLDWETLNRLVEDSPDFSEFVADISTRKSNPKYDELFSEEKLKQHILKKGLLLT